MPTAAERRHDEMMAAIGALTGALARDATGNTITQDSRVSIAMASGLVVVLLGVASFLFQLQGRVDSIEKNMFTREQSSELTAEIKSLTRAIADLEEFTEKPRFTEEDFDTRIVPIEQRLRLTENALASRSDWMDEIEDAIDQHDDRLKDSE